MNIQDQMLKAYIDQIFDKYDYDKSGTLDQNEMTDFFNELFKALGMNPNVTKQQALQAIKSIDQNSDGGVDKKQLFDAFKAMMNKPVYNPPPPPQYNPYSPVNHNPYVGYNSYQQPPPQYYPPNHYQQNNYANYQYNDPYNNPQNQYMTNTSPYMQNNPYPYTQNQRYGMGGSGWGRKN